MPTRNLVGLRSVPNFRKKLVVSVIGANVTGRFVRSPDLGPFFVAARCDAVWACPVLVPPQVLFWASFRSKATGLFHPNAESRRRGL